MNFTGMGLRLTDEDLRHTADLLGCDVPAVKAILAVESSGRGFGANDRPIILFEPHIFWRLLGPGVKRDAAKLAHVAYPLWGEHPYPATQTMRYQQLMKAVAIDRDRGLESASWGLGQVMGFNWQACGCESVLHFVELMKASEGAQLEVMARFIKSKRLHLALAAHDWAAFAFGYNGQGYEKHGYHMKLAKAYAKAQGRVLQT
jgi:hypothetical protein